MTELQIRLLSFAENRDTVRFATFKNAFAYWGKKDAIAQALQQLVKSGKLAKVKRGRYSCMK